MSGILSNRFLFAGVGMLDDIEGKRIYLFGAADSMRIWIERFGIKDQVVCAFDNDSSKWGKK